MKCPICYKPYKRQIALDNHIKTIKEANNKKPGVYWLLPEAISEIKAEIVYKIKSKLKQHARYTGSYRVKVNCTERAYNILSQIFNDVNWGVKQK
ncbi:hypothetical protein C1645_828550 [Glomus cerebriforme]|uniref:C2H2-type domain-containing protein n=1 Tax=Glomus cerebriforme TaxID=658196 RepID=A0A397SSA0_9GLOM|nr:hypothetical protein C1645_828550 [Glomus cerebriforme]